MDAPVGAAVFKNRIRSGIFSRRNPKFLFEVSVYERGCPFRLVALGSNVL